MVWAKLELVRPDAGGRSDAIESGYRTLLRFDEARLTSGLK